MNVFDYVNNYINTSATGTYGDLLESNNEGKLDQILTVQEREVYNQIKVADMNRLLMREQRQNTPIMYNTNVHYVNGIGDVQQIC